MLLRVRNKHIISRLLIVKLTLAFGLLTLYPLEADGKRNSELRELLQQLETGDRKYKLQKSPNKYCDRQASSAAKAEFRDLVRQMKNGGATYKHIPNSWVGGSRYSGKDETYAKPRYRTTPDSNPYNNDSYHRNYKPNTGTITPRNSQKSPNRYYKRRTARAASAEFRDLAHQMRTGGAKYKYNTNSSVRSSSYSRKDRTYASPHYRTTPDSTPKRSSYTHYSQPITDLRELLRQLESGGTKYYSGF